MDNPLLDYHQDDDEPPMPTEAELRAQIAQSDRDVVAIPSTPLADVLAMIEAAADRIEARIRFHAA